MFKFYLSTLKTNSIGHLVYNPIRFFYFYKDKKKIYILINKSEIVNITAYEIIKYNFNSKKIIFIENFFFLFLFRKLIKLSKYFKFINKFINNIETYHNRHLNKNLWTEHNPYPIKKYGGYSYYQFDTKSLINKPKFKIINYFFEYYKNWKIKNKIKNNHVLLFSRDGGYYNEKSINTRNADFKKLDKTIDYLIKKNIHVIRIGRNPKTNYKNKSHLFFDYAHRYKEKYDNIAEVMMYSDCKFLLSNNSGILSIQWFFNNKILLYDYFPIGLRPGFLNCVYILKKLKKNNKYIKFKNINKNILLSEDINDYKKNNIMIEDNSEVEIYNFVKYNLDKINFKNKIDYKNFVVRDSGKDTSYLCNQWHQKNKKKLFD